ncbi:hypothetical protein REMIM1_PE00275 (plasmid) [Rhizobium etli bv. mimosae str. Mim1]|nr:hypothetical protein REMIM1_PE00275 [Rhizobium etli bv. mimosae str. Mim1]
MRSSLHNKGSASALFSTSDCTFMSLLIAGLSVKLVFDNPTASENTDGRRHGGCR